MLCWLLQGLKVDDNMSTFIATHRVVQRVLRTPVNARFATLFILFYSTVMEVCISYLHLPGLIRYLNDVVLIACLFGVQGRFFAVLRKQKAMVLWYATCVLFLFDIVTSVVNLVSPMLVLWAIRNTFRGIAYLFCVIAVLRIEDIPRLMRVLLWLQVPNLVLAAYEYLVTSGGNPDYVHGLFANGAGTNTFGALLLAYYLNAFLSRRVGGLSLVFVVISTIMIAAMAEEKTFFLYFILIVVTSVLISRWSLKTFFVIAFLGVAGFVMIGWINQVQPEMLSFFIDVDTGMNYLTSTWSDSYGIPRIGAFAFITSRFFHDDFVTSLFGFGFGSAEHSQFSLMDSEFYRRYENLMYRSFTHQWTFLETGYIGFALLVCLFIVALICLCRRRWEFRDCDRTLNLTAICMCLVCIISMWSNATLKLDAAYIPYFGVALGFLVSISQVRNPWIERRNR